MAKGAAPEGQQPSGDNSLDFLWMMALIIAGVLLAWYFGKIYITMAVFKVKLYEILAINYALVYWAKVAHTLHLTVPDLSSLNQSINFIRENYGGEVKFQELSGLCLMVGNYLRYPVASVLAILAGFLYFGSASENFKEVFSMEKLKAATKPNWPHLTPVFKLDLVNTKLDEAPWAMALSPMKFCKKHDLLIIERKAGKYDVTLKRGLAQRLLALQLGARWRGHEALPIHLKALFAVFAAKLNNDKIATNALLEQISLSSGGNNLDFSGVEALLRKYGYTKAVMRTTYTYGYVTTVMASMLAAAREFGVLATSEFLWLKKVDRHMWYMLNSVGRYTAVAEISGAFSHWLAEKKLGLPLYVPAVEEGVRGLEIALSEIMYKPDEDE